MKKLMIIAVVAIVAASAFASGSHRATTPWDEPCSVDIPVIMDIVPVCSVDLNSSVIKLTLSDENTDSSIWYEGVADPMPILHANVSVDIEAEIAALEPSIARTSGHNDSFHVALRDQIYWSPATPSVQYDPLVIGSGIGIEIAASIRNPDLSVRPEGIDIPVAVVTLTVTPLP